MSADHSEPAKVRLAAIGGEGLILLLEDGTLWTGSREDSGADFTGPRVIWRWKRVPVPLADRNMSCSKYVIKEQDVWGAP